MKTPAETRSRVCFALAPALLCSLSTAGCRSNKQPSSASFASVVISNRSVAEIQRAAIAVFAEADYRTATYPDGEMKFEKEGTRGQQFACGALATDSAVAVRVRAQIVPLTDGSHCLQCKAYIVRDAGDAFFENETRLSSCAAAHIKNCWTKSRND